MTEDTAPTAWRRRLTPRRRTSPPSALASRWTTVDGINVYYRESPPPDAPVMTHVHGFGLSGRYLLPTAELLADEFHTLVPDLPGFGRSGRARTPSTCRTSPTRRGVPRRAGGRDGDARRQLDGLPGHLRVRAPLPGARRPGRPRLAGRWHAQPAAPGGRASSPSTAVREPPGGGGRRPRLSAVRRPEHGRLFRALTQLPLARAAARARRPDARRARRP